MKIRLVVVGKIREKYLRLGIEEYLKRMGRYMKVEIVELKDEPAADKLSPAQEIQVLDREAERILSKIDEGDLVVPLAIEGKKMDSVQFSKFIFHEALHGRSSLVFVIGGSLGLADSVMKRGDYPISFSQMTFPHQLMRLILLEQIYRACRIEKGHTYHK